MKSRNLWRMQVKSNSPRVKVFHYRHVGRRNTAAGCRIRGHFVGCSWSLGSHGRALGRGWRRGRARRALSGGLAGPQWCVDLARCLAKGYLLLDWNETTWWSAIKTCFSWSEKSLTRSNSSRRYSSSSSTNANNTLKKIMVHLSTYKPAHGPLRG